MKNFVLELCAALGLVVLNKNEAAECLKWYRVHYNETHSGDLDLALRLAIMADDTELARDIHHYLRTGSWYSE